MHVGSESLVVDRGIALHKLARLTTVGTAAHGYLNFMGNEFGHPEWIDFPREGNGWSCDKARRQWSLRDDPKLRFHHLADFDSAMLSLVDASWDDEPAQLVKADDGDKVLIWRRGQLLFAINFHPFTSFFDYGVQVGEMQCQLILSSDDPRFGGFARIPAGLELRSDDEGWLRFYLPARTGMVMKIQTAI